VFWAACLVLFYGILRKSNLFLDNGAFDPEKQLTRDNFLVTNNESVTLAVSWSKTIQRKERTLYINLPVLVDHPLCPVSEIVAMLRAVGPAHPKSQSFPIRGSEFNKRLRALTAREAGISRPIHFGGAGPRGR
jgi:hypothetical protein